MIDESNDHSKIRSPFDNPISVDKHVIYMQLANTQHTGATLIFCEIHLTSIFTLLKQIHFGDISTVQSSDSILLNRVNNFIVALSYYFEWTFFNTYLYKLRRFLIL